MTSPYQNSQTDRILPKTTSPALHPMGTFKWAKRKVERKHTRERGGHDTTTKAKQNFRDQTTPLRRTAADGGFAGDAVSHMR